MPKHDIDTSTYAELFKEAVIIQKIREQYSKKLDSKFPNSIALDPYQDKKKNKVFNAQGIPASEVIQRAYPVLRYDENGMPIDNREQEFIDTVFHFARNMSKKKKMTREEQELNCATKVYAALSSIEMQQERLKTNLAKIEKNLEGNDKKEAIEQELKTFRGYCDQLLDALHEHHRLLVKESEKSKFDKMIHALENFIELVSSLWSKKKLHTEHDKAPVGHLQQIHKDRHHARTGLEPTRFDQPDKPNTKKRGGSNPT